MSNFQDLIDQLNNGELPKELDFSVKPHEPIDWEKVKYNTFYKQPSFFINKFPNPKAFLNLAGASDIINSMTENAKTPLEEMLEKQKISNDIVNITNAMDELPQTINN